MKQKVVGVGIYPDMLARIQRVLEHYPGLSRTQLIHNALEVELSRLELLHGEEEHKVDVSGAAAALRELAVR